jgi:hypothetical protein
VTIEPILIFEVGHVSDVRKDFQPGIGDRSVHCLGFVDGAVGIIGPKHDQARDFNLCQRFSVITSQSAPTKVQRQPLPDRLRKSSGTPRMRRKAVF